MSNTNIETLAARLDIRAIALQEMVRVLSAPQAATVAAALRDRVAGLAGKATASPIDAAIASELAHLLQMLSR